MSVATATPLFVRIHLVSMKPATPESPVDWLKWLPLMGVLSVFHTVLLEFVGQLVLSTAQVQDPKVVRCIDRFLLARTSHVNLTDSRPANGRHFVWWRWTAPIMVVREEPYGRGVYTLSTWRLWKRLGNDRLAEFVSQCSAQPTFSGVDSVQLFERQNGYTAVRRTLLLPAAAHSHQLAVLKKLDLNPSDADANNKVLLLSGPPGMGKTAMGRIIGQHLLALKPLLVHGFHPSAVGVLQIDVLWYKRDHQPLIVVIDDIELAMRQSKMLPGGGEATAGGKMESQETDAPPLRRPVTSDFLHARDKASLSALFDDWCEMPGVIVVCTTNAPLREMRAKYPEYIRNGRFTHRVSWYPDDEIDG